MSDPLHERPTDKAVLMFISGGLIAVLLAIILGLFLSPRTLPNWAENVLVATATACALKLGDCIGALVQLASGKSVDRLSTKLADSAPIAAPPPDAPISVRVEQPADDPVPVKGS